jgi:transmembrane sensor
MNAPVQEIVAQAAQWRERRDGNDWSDADQAAFDTWLNQSLGHRVEYWRIDAAWSRADRLVALKSPGVKRSPGIFRASALKGIAALIGTVAIGLAWTGYFDAPREKIYSTPVGGREILTLADGSQIELNTDTTLRTRVNDGQRTVFLDKGEAFFKVKHDAAHPFVVTAAGHRVVDLGTKFVIRNSGDRLEVSLIEGSARFEPLSDKNNQQPIVLTPGEVVIATADTITQKKKTEQMLADETGWRRGIIVLHRTTLAEAVAEFNRYNVRKLVIATPSLERTRVGGTFPVEDVEAFTRVAKQVLGLEVQEKGDEILISR